MNYPLDNNLLLIFGTTIAVLFVLVMVLAATTFYIRIRSILKAKTYQAQEDIWEPLILDYMFGDAAIDDIKEVVAKGEELRFIGIVVRYLKKIKGAEADRLISLTAPYRYKLVQGLDHSNPARRARAYQTLCLLAFKEYPLQMMRGLKDPSLNVSLVVAWAMAQRKQVEYLEEIMIQIGRYANWNRNFLVAMVSSFGPAGSSVLLEILNDASRSSISRGIAADALAKLNYFDASTVLPDLLQAEEDPELIAALLRLACEVGRPDNMEFIRPYLSHADGFVRGQAYRAVGSLGDMTDLPLLEFAIREDTHWVAYYASIALFEIGGKEPLEAMISQGFNRSAMLQEVLARGIPV